MGLEGCRGADAQGARGILRAWDPPVVSGPLLFSANSGQAVSLASSVAEKASELSGTLLLAVVLKIWESNLPAAAAHTSWGALVTLALVCVCVCVCV